jgi:hypothetical protein
MPYRLYCIGMKQGAIGMSNFTEAIAIMLIVSRFVVRIVDATVQIDNDIGMLLLLLALVNAVIGFVGYKLYQAAKRTDGSKK